jgi:urea transport system ATP-binding protein
VYLRLRAYKLPILELNSLTKRFGGVAAVDDLTLTLEAGSLSALIGPNGCGKSTLFNLISGKFHPNSGEIIFKNKNITNFSPEKIAQLGIGRKFQVPSIFPDLSVADNLKLPTFHSSKADLQTNQFDKLLDLIRLTSKQSLLAGHLAHGQKQWLEIGMLLAQKPDLILLDEPTAGMTAEETMATAHLIKTIQSTNDVTLLVIEHDIGFVEKLNCPLRVMSKGQIIKAGAFSDIRADSDVKELYFGQEALTNA